ncbi:hypothetical protein NM208_g434 [Fusarium decemcellulare]|uniref:Uncharacterized protein n=1 Tax=Fusarium decemcellulare TaxID=57161 RepID=A0ACC1T065_9HYPO|nr:hypothetical protein NM208_g434 [Fusarium decemcellulare]
MPPILPVAKALHYGCAFAAVAFVSITILTNLGRATKTKFSATTRHRFPCALLLLSYVADVVLTVIQPNGSSEKEAQIFHLIFLTSAWAVAWSQHSRAPQLICGTSIVTLLFELPLLVILLLTDIKGLYPALQLSCQTTRVVLLLLLAVHQLYNRIKRTSLGSNMEESRPFLRSQSPDRAPQCPSYGTEASIGIPAAESDDDDDIYTEGSDSEDDSASIKRQRAKRLKETGGWMGYLSDFSVFVPYLVPKKDHKVQFCLLLCLICLVANRVLNVMVPRQLGIVADQLLAGGNPFKPLFIWLVLSALGNEGASGLIESLAKIPIKQFSYRQITNAAFNHVLALPMEFHSERDSAEVMKAIEQGESLTNFLETLVIEILPTVADLFIAFGLLYVKFNSYVALAMAAAAAIYISLEVTASSWNIKNRRESSKSQREEARVMHQAVQGWQTVTYFNMFGFEKRRFGQAVDKQLTASRVWGYRDAYTQAALDVLIPCTFFVLGSLVLFEISQGRSSPGDFVFLIQYWEYLIWPLKFLSNNYRFLMSDLVDAERLLYLLRTKPTIVDKEGAKDLDVVKGHVAFEHVDFSYDPRKHTIQGLSLSIAPGKTVALVGETGAGKSSIMKLLLRFYDVTGGSIKIDGYDIRDITLSSLRNALGVVPQDPLLFNASVLENLRYARPSATDAEIHQACRAAAIHEKILTFADGYETQVGEQGVKLSGGEIQRLAIARVFLKNPPILILDEATSAVDTNTESCIQGALDTLKRERSTFVIAHRLSTIVNADQILVVHGGKIVESGTHAELISGGGRYHELWNKQVGGI